MKIYAVRAALFLSLILSAHIQAHPQPMQEESSPGAPLAFLGGGTCAVIGVLEGLGPRGSAEMVAVGAAAAVITPVILAGYLGTNGYAQTAYGAITFAISLSIWARNYT